jgi:hypothetical protein
VVAQQARSVVLGKLREVEVTIWQQRQRGARFLAASPPHKQHDLASEISPPAKGLPAKTGPPTGLRPPANHFAESFGGPTRASCCVLRTETALPYLTSPEL